MVACVGAAAAALLQDGHTISAAGFILKAKVQAGRLRSSARKRFLIWTLDGLAYGLHLGGAVAVSAAALDEALWLATGELTRDIVHDLLLLSLHPHRVVVLLQLPPLDWQECVQKVQRSMQEARLILSSLLLSNRHAHDASQQALFFHSHKAKPSPLPPKPAAALPLPGGGDDESNAADAEQCSCYLNNLAHLFQRLQTAVVTRFHARKMELSGLNNDVFGGGISRAPLQHSIPHQVLLQPLSAAHITVQIVAINAARGGRAVHQSAAAAKCARLLKDCGVSRSSAGALVALLHTHLQMCLQIQSGSTQAPSDFAPQSMLWVPSLTLLHLMGMGDSTPHAANGSQHQGAMHALADVLVDAGLSFKHSDCVDQWTSEALPAVLQRGSNDALAAAHQLRLQHVVEVLPVRAAVIGLEAVLNCSSCSNGQVLLHAVAAVDASMLLLRQNAHGCARQLLQLSDVTLSAICLYHHPWIKPQLASVIKQHCYNIDVTQPHHRSSKSPVDLIVSAHSLLPFLRASSNAIHGDVVKLQGNVQISFVKL